MMHREPDEQVCRLFEDEHGEVHGVSERVERESGLHWAIVVVFATTTSYVCHATKRRKNL